MEENDDILNFDDLQEIEDPQDLFNPFYPLPEWAECPEESLNVGCDYVYFVSGEIYYRCHVLFNDGVSAILRITNRYYECFQDILFYQEVKRYFLDFEDPEATDRSEYVCLDIETGQSYFCRFEYEDDIYCYLEEEDGELAPYLIDPADFREWRESSKAMNKLLLYSEGGHSGYIDWKGNVVIPIKYPVARFFSEGLAWVNDDDGKWCLINEEGEVVLSCDWSVVGDFHDGLAFVKDASKRIGYIDKTGMNVIPCQWKVADDFSEGLAAVQDENGNYGYIDKIGQLVIPCQYMNAKPFQNGLAVVQISDNEWTFIDKTGKRPYSIWAEVRAFSEGLAPVKNADGLWGYINEKGEVVLDFQWTDAYSFSEGLAAVSNGDKYGYINKQGEMVIPYQWLVAADFSEGMAPVSVSMMKMGYINTKGEMIVPDRWTFACSHKDGVAFVADAMTMESGYIDRTGRFFNPSHPLELSADEAARQPD